MKNFTKHLIVRYIISGGSSAAINLLFLSLFYYVFHIYYILSSILSFIIAFFVSLVMQKMWTFKDMSMDKIHLQAGKYLLSSLFGLMINTFVLYIMVDHLHFYVFLGQIIAGAVTASITFFISRDLVFNYKKEQ